MEPVICFLDREDADIHWKILVKVGLDLLTGIFAQQPWHPVICHLMQCVDTGIGASGAVDLNGLPIEMLQNQLQFFLNGVWGIALSLPAVVPCSIILDDKTKISHIKSFLYHSRATSSHIQ